jgi:hypothetical protein
MTMSEHRPPGDARRRGVRFAPWRAVAAAPAVLGSLLLLMLASVALGRWAALLLLAWTASAGALMTRVGERIAVRPACGFRRPSPGQAATLQPTWGTALRVTRTAAGGVELYVQDLRAVQLDDQHDREHQQRAASLDPQPRALPVRGSPDQGSLPALQGHGPMRLGRGHVGKTGYVWKTALQPVRGHGMPVVEWHSDEGVRPVACRCSPQRG